MPPLLRNPILNLFNPYSPLRSNQSSAQLYRSLLTHLRRLPDPHLWSIIVPHFKQRLIELRQCPLDDDQLARGEHVSVGAGKGIGEEGQEGEYQSLNVVEGSRDGDIRQSRRFRILRKARKDVDQVRMAVAYYPHALARLLEKAYGIRGRVRWELIKNVTLSSNIETDRYPPSHLQPLPPPLRPLAPSPITPASANVKRATQVVKPTAIRKAAYRAWRREWDQVGVPLILGHPPSTISSFSTSKPFGTYVTGWEGKGVVESLQILAGMQDPLISQIPRRARGLYPNHSSVSPPKGTSISSVSSSTSKPSQTLGSALPSYVHLPKYLQRIFPRRKYPQALPLQQAYPRPPPRSVRQNPKTWTEPKALTGRVIRRAYARLWDKLVWVRWIDYSSGTEEHAPNEGKEIGIEKTLEREKAKTRKRKTRMGGDIGKVEMGARGRWEKCTYEELMGIPSRGPRISPASEEDLYWILGDKGLDDQGGKG